MKSLKDIPFDKIYVGMPVIAISERTAWQGVRYPVYLTGKKYIGNVCAKGISIDGYKLIVFNFDNIIVPISHEACLKVYFRE